MTDAASNAAKLEEAQREVLRLNTLLRGTNYHVLLSMRPVTDDCTEDVWAAVAARTRGTRTALRLAQVCRASREGVTKKAPGLWKTLAGKHGIARSKEIATWSNVGQYLKKRESMKRELLGFGGTSGITRLQNKGLEQVLRDVERVMSFGTLYQTAATALLHASPSGTGIRTIKLPKWEAGVSVHVAMAALCAVYAAVCKPTRILVIIRPIASGTWANLSSKAICDAMDCLEDLLNGTTANGGFIMPTDEAASRTDGMPLELRLCNSSMIVVQSTLNDEYPYEFDAVVMARVPDGQVPTWMLRHGLNWLTESHRCVSMIECK